MRIVLIAACMLPLIMSCQNPQTRNRIIDSIGIQVTPKENRDIAYTDKWSAYYYVKSHQTSVEWFSGWNISTHRIVQDYHIEINGMPLDRSLADVTVYPHVLERQYPSVIERFRMVDNLRILEVELEGGDEYSFALEGYQLAFGENRNGIAYFNCIESANGLIVGVAPINPVEMVSNSEQKRPRFQTAATGGGFLIAADSSKAKIADLISQYRATRLKLRDARENRMEELVSSNYFKSNLPDLDLALRWTLLSLDALVTRQTGDGIYAGLPWFNDYWGRDLFISYPGAVLVTGQYNVARSILMSFARYQNTDEKSPDFGRVPNRLRPGDIIYNTTDGTPRFVIELLNYIRYTGDSTIAYLLFPHVKRSIEGPLKYRVDKNGYLTHDDADTWMDAKIADKIPLSPRGNRANDIQALWYGQLRAGAEIARLAGSFEDAKKWNDLAEKLRSRFQSDFLDESRLLMADRLNPNGNPDYSMRPNQFFAFDLIRQDSLKWKMTRKVWEDLVFPWGVSSLSQSHVNFYPWHSQTQMYREDFHKDWAYHNGTVWLWNNGIAMQRMLEAWMPEPAFQLFKNQADMALDSRGAVGAMAELTDAFPSEGSEVPRFSGTFTQAWSMAEFLRVWYQNFLGIQPDGRKRIVALTPQMPDSIFSLDYRVPVLNASLSGSFHRSLEHTRWTFGVDSLSADLTLVLKFPGFEPVPAVMYTGEKLVATVEGTKLTTSLIDSTGEPRADRVVFMNSGDQIKIDQAREIMNNVRFATPVPKDRYRGADGPPVW